ncbi:hypothetical protein ACFO0A_07275 [Novosphingobium tardum]|uniref:Uncharacterized protein n=1 Tax=Novosphingobium tardum TaxID=1538021 RepID=A0ABV8RP33_9SPHN
MATVALKAGIVRREGRDRFYSRTALLMALLVLSAFPLTYFGPLMSGSHRFRAIVHIHGLAFFAWIALYALQTELAARGRIARHRELGLAGIALSALMLPLGLAAAIVAVRERQARGDAHPFAFTLYNVIDIALFAILMTCAIACITRHQEWHRRLTFGAALCLVGPAISRWFLPFPGVFPWTDFAPNLLADLFLIPLAMHDRKVLGGVHQATLWMAAILVPIHIVTPWLTTSAAWNALAPAIMHLAP